MGLSKKYSKMVALCTAILMTGTAISGVNTSLTANAVSEYNYAKGLQYTMYLYDANMCGTGVDENSKMAWRDDCHTYDATATYNGQTVDVSGGYHDAGDHVKFGLPQAYSASILGWGYYEFKDAYTQTGQSDHMKTISTYFADYFKNCTIMDSSGNVTAFCYQVGEGNSDHSEWCSPESQTLDRPTYWATSSNPATDIVSNTAGALAFHYANFGDSESLTYAKALYNFAKSNSKAVATEGVSGFYSSDSYVDDLMWAAAALYTATGDSSYLSDASNFLTESGNAYIFCSDWPLCWGNMWPAVNLIFSKSGGVSGPYGDLQSDMKSQVEKAMTTFQSKDKADGVFNCQDSWGSARYNTAMQLVGLVYDKYNNTSTYSEWAKTQMDYLMGNNSNGLCYITGFSSASVTQPHHRAATGYDGFPSENVGVPYANTLIGALVGGPDKDGYYIDDVNEYTYTEVAIDYNAGIVGAMAGLYLKYGSGQTVDDESSITGIRSSSGGSSGGSTTTTTTTTTATSISTSTSSTTTSGSSGGSTGGSNILDKAEVKDNSDGTSTLIIYVDTDDSSTVTLTLQGLAGYTTSGQVGYWDNSAQAWIDDVYSWENQKFDSSGNLTISGITVPTNQDDVQIMVTYYADWSTGSEVKGDMSGINVVSVVSGSGSSSSTSTSTTIATSNTTVTTTPQPSGGSSILDRTEVKNNSDGTSTLIVYVDTDDSSTVTLTLQGLAGYTTSGQVGYWDNSAQAWVDDVYSWENQKFDSSGNLTISGITVPTNQDDVQIMVTYYADWSTGSEVKGNISDINVLSAVSGSSSSSSSSTTTTSKTTTTTKATTTASSSTTTTTTTSSSSTGTLSGDVNGDGQIKNNDAQIVRQYLLHMSDLSADAMSSADVSGDGQVKNNDVQLIRQYILHVITSF